MSSTTQIPEHLKHLTVNPSLMKILHDEYPSMPMDRKIHIAREAQRKKERRSSIPFYAKKAEQQGDRLWIDLSISFQGTHSE
jgi:hypothetical protein